MINRRNFIRLLLTTSIAETIDVEKLLWTPTKTIFIPSKKQIEFLNSNVPVNLYGIPYHQYLGTTGTWLGLTRSEVPMFSSQWNKKK